jgi:hypothetical protein
MILHFLILKYNQMKTVLTFTLTLFVFSLNSQSVKLYQNHECGKSNLVLQDMDQSNPLYPYLVGEDRDGFIQTHPFTLDEVGGWGAFQQALAGNVNTTFEFAGITKSRLFSGYFLRYQQLFHGIPVVNGGFTIHIEPDPDYIPGPPCDGCPPVPLCGLISGVASYVMGDFNAGLPTNA